MLALGARIGLLRDLRRGALELAHDLVAGPALDDFFDVGSDMSGRDGEELRVGPDLLVLLAGQRYALDAGRVPALADQVKRF